MTGPDRAALRIAAWLVLLQQWPNATTGQPAAMRKQGRAWLQLLTDTPVTEKHYTSNKGPWLLQNSAWHT